MNWKSFENHRRTDGVRGGRRNLRAAGRRIRQGVRQGVTTSPFEQEYLGVERCVTGDGLAHVVRQDEFMDPPILKTIDLFLFPDIGYGGLQRYLRSIGKPVWGSFGASNLELYRTKFLKVLEEVGLPVAKSKTILGLSRLADHLREVKNVWVKVNRFRENMETFHHQDFTHSQRELERLAVVFGPLKELVTFVVQAAIDGAQEIGYDELGTPTASSPSSFSGYEKKNEVSLGSLLTYGKMPEPVREVNERFAKVLDKLRLLQTSWRPSFA